ncbi:DsbA family protein [Nocardiopsis coralliicola]
MRNTARPDGGGPLWWIVGAVVTVILAVGAVGLYRAGGEGGAPSGGAGPAGGVTPELRELGETLARRDAEDPMALGPADAPVVLVAYSDYQCPFCAKWVAETQPELVERYVDKGDLRIEWREFPYLGAESELLSIGAHAAAAQDRFWEYHRDVYAAQEELKEAGSDLEPQLVEHADGAGLDPDRFQSDLGDPELASAVDEEFREGQQLGVSGTPAFFINGQPVMGAQPIGVFTDAIDTALAEAEG